MFYKDLIVWQKAMQLTDMIYDLTEQFPRREFYGLASQMRRAAVSIPSNIAEGSRYRNQGSQKHHMIIAYGSLSELETQLLIASRRNYFSSENGYDNTKNLIEEVSKMLNKMISRYF